jgi:hypothetical protein
VKRPAHAARSGFVFPSRKYRKAPHEAGGGGGTAPDARRGAVRAFFLAVVARPWLWPVAAAEILRLASPRWWVRWPPVPLPTSSLWRFRMETAYGGMGDSLPSTEDVRSFLEWCAQQRTWRKL